MASTVFELSIRVIVFTLTIAIATLPTCAEEILCNTETTCHIGKEKFIVKTTVTPSRYHESQNVTYPEYKEEIRNGTVTTRFHDEMESVTSEPTSAAARCSFEETAAEDLAALLDAGESALVTLVAGEARLTAHRAVLATRSPTFAAMLCHGSQDASSGQVDIPDVEGPVMRQILAYLYTLQAPQLPAMAPQLLAAADKFGLSALKSHCEAQVAAQLDVETAAATAVLAIRHSSTSLRQAAIAFIRAHTYQVMATQGWADATQYQSEYMSEVYRLLSELPIATSEQNTSLGSTPATADSQPTTEAQSSQDQTAASTASPTPACPTPPPCDDAVSRLRPQNASLGSTPTAADSQPTTEAQSSQGQTPATTALPTPACPTPSLDDDAVSCLRALPSVEKERRLFKAAQEGRVEEVEALLVAGTDVGARDEDWWTALHLAAYWGRVEVARRLVGAGAEVDARGRWQQTPLHRAAFWGRTAVEELLLAASADPNARDVSGWTPLHHAAYSGIAEAVAVLLEAGAGKEATTGDGRTPLDLARSNYKQQVIRLLT